MERRSLLPGLILVVLGAYLLVANIFGLSGMSFLLALGVAFLAAYVWRQRYGLLIVGCLLISQGAFAVLQETGLLSYAEGGWFLVFLGVGFLAIYPASLRWHRWWPLIPGFVLVGSGLLCVYAVSRELSWSQWLSLAQWWPAALVVLGAWLLVRQYMPRNVSKVVGASLAVLIVSGLSLMAVSAGVIATNSQGFQLVSGIGPEYSDKYEQEIPAPVEGQLVVTSTVGGIVVHSTDTSTVRVIANKHAFASNEQQAQRILDGMTIDVARNGNEIQISAVSPDIADRSRFSWFGGSPWVDYEIYAPATMGVRTVASTGDTTIEGIRGGIESRTSTGRLTLRNVSGAINAETSTGGIEFSGLIDRDSSFRTSTGGIDVTVSPKSAFDLVVQTSTGGIQASLPIENKSQQERSLRGSYNGGGANLQIRSSTGGVKISQQ